VRSFDIRRSFVEFFQARGHEHVPSSSLVPAGDPTLLFTNAGMVQFKRVFQGLEHRSEKRAVTVQKCVRAGGKHNDLEQVGHTARHHTFFEMLGNFSFGDYFKREAIAFGWEWVTSERYLGIHPDRIYVSVHESDDEARRLWREVTGIANERIYGLGDKDNFWQMGDTGPCGPCSEIYVDLRSDGRLGGWAVGSERHQPPNRLTAQPPTLEQFLELTEAGQLLEIWNLVFMQFDQAADGSRTPLPAPSVDTGAGLERIAAVMQRVGSNFDTDLFTPMIQRAVEVIGRPYDQGPRGAGFRVLADHARAVAFLLADGVYPSNDGRGYVLRRILRRAVRHAFLLGRKDPTLVDLTAVVVETMGGVYRELKQKADHIASVTRAEEERFLETIEDGLKRLDEIIVGASGTVSGEDAFKLYDTYGFPVDLTQIIAAERGWAVDVVGFDRALEQQQDRSRRARRVASGSAASASTPVRRAPGGRRGFTRVRPRLRQRFVGYEATSVETDVLAFRLAEDRLELVLHENPFYAESGGQVSDTGVVKGQDWELRVSDVRKLEGLQVVVGPWNGPFDPTPVEAIVAEERRRNIERNHSATHLVHAALRKVLGTHVRQAGSVVAPERLRFDFSHHQPVGDAALSGIEEEVNRGVWANVDVETYEMSYADAIAQGAMALFGEKYGERVRLVDMPGISKELCGGTHVRTTGQIGFFHFTTETGVAAGVRRIEAVTGPGAYAAIRELDQRLSQAADALRTNPEALATRIEALLAERKRLEKQIEELLRTEARGPGAGVTGEEHRINGTLLVVGDAPVPDRDQIGLLMDAFRDKQRNAVQVLFVRGDRPGVHVGVTDDLISRGVRADDVASGIAAVSGGRGGGRPHFASAGVGDPALFEEMRRRVPEIVSNLLKAAAA
jgi:alanyl-tRNA synthetase